MSMDRRKTLQRIIAEEFRDKEKVKKAFKGILYIPGPVNMKKHNRTQ